MSSEDKIISRSLGLLWNSSACQTVINLIILIFRSFLPLAGVLLIKYFVDNIIGPEGKTASSLLPAITGLIAALSAALLADDLLSSLGNYTSRKQAYLLEKHITSIIHKHTADLGLRYFEDPSYHDMLSRAVRDISWRPAGLVSDVMLLMRGIISFAAMAVIIIKFSIVSLGVLVVAFTPVLWIKIRNSGRLYNVRKHVTPLSRQASYFSWLLTGERPAREVKLFGLNRFFEGLYRKNFSASGEEELAAIKKNSSTEALASVFKMLAFGGILVYASISFINTRITAGEMAMYLIAFRQAMIYLRDSVSGISGLFEDRMFVKDIFLFLNLEKEIESESKTTIIPSFNEISIRNLTFTYPDSSTPALKNVSLYIRKGEKIAIVGPNGSGKTTLVKLFCRLYEPGEGSVEIEGINSVQFNLSEYRRLFSVVFQDFMLYYLTAAENIRLGDTSGDSDMGRIREAATKAGIADFLTKLPEGFDTMLGHHTEGGRELSWGEWQKMAIARALYRDAPILILDEPSSSLDADSEYEIFSRLAEIAKGKTCILISHRLASVSDADRIILLDKGKVSETGTHEELMAARGRYCSMFNRQKAMYK